MPRSYRRVIAAVGGVVLLAAAPHESSEAKGEKPASQQNSQPELKRIAAALENLPRNPPPDQGCGTSKEDRRSNLCAQWKAADAAADSAWWAMATFAAGLFALGFGGLTLYFAAYAARWAREAARHTERGSDAAHQGVRPWIAFEDPKSVKIQFGGGDGFSINVALDLINYGNSPALKPRLATGLVFETTERRAIKAGVQQRLRSVMALTSLPIYNGQKVNRWGDYIQGVEGRPGVTAANFASDFNPTLLIYVGYQAIGGEIYYVGDEFLLHAPKIDAEGGMEFPVTRLFGGDNVEAT